MQYHERSLVCTLRSCDNLPLKRLVPFQLFAPNQ